MMRILIEPKSERVDVMVKWVLFTVISSFLMSIIVYQDEGNWRNYTSYLNFLQTNPIKYIGIYLGGLVFSVPMILLFAVLKFMFRLQSWRAFVLAILLSPVALALVGAVLYALLWMMVNLTGMKY